MLVIDSVTIEAPNARYPECVRWTEEKTDLESGITVRIGRLGNLRITEYPDRSCFITGSLAKFLREENLRTMTRSEVNRAIDKLASTLGIEPEFSMVFQLEVSATVELKCPVATYLPSFGKLARFQKVTHDLETVRYQHGSRSVSFYDKAREAGAIGNLLRYEQKYKHKLKRQVKQSVTLADLCSLSLQVRLLEKWLKDYQHIKKIKRQLLVPPKDGRDWTNQLLKLGIQSAGGADLISSTLERFGLESGFQKRCEKKVYDLVTTGNSIEDKQRIEELNAVIRAVPDYVLNN